MNIRIPPEVLEQARAARYTIFDRGHNQRMNLFVWGAVATLIGVMVTLAIAGLVRNHNNLWPVMIAFPLPVLVAVILIILLKFNLYHRRKTMLARLAGEQENLEELYSQFDNSIERLDSLKERERSLKLS